MAIRTYEVQLRSAGTTVQTEKGISLRAVCHMQDLTAEQADEIADLQIGSSCLLFEVPLMPGSGIFIKRTA